MDILNIFNENVMKLSQMKGQVQKRSWKGGLRYYINFYLPDSDFIWTNSRKEVISEKKERKPLTNSSKKKNS